MFNSAAWDVVIGMVLIYLLYSLLVTIIGEMVATWMGLRSRILRVAIEKMLNDGYLDANGKPRYNSWWHFIPRFVLTEFPGFKDSFAGKFYQQASIKYLSSKVDEKITPFSQTKPSYISDTNFAHTLTAMLTEKGMGATTMDKINYCLNYNIAHIQPQTLAHLQRLASEAGSDVELFATKLKGWFNETNDRATGWYKRKLQLILFWLGFTIAAAFNVDSIQIARFLAKDKDARINLANMAIAQANDSLRYTVFLNDRGDTLRNKTALDSGLALAKSDIKQANLILGLGWGLDTLTKDCKICFSAPQKGADNPLLKNWILYKNTDSVFNQSNTVALNLVKKLDKQKERLKGLLGLVNNPAIKTALKADSILKLNDTVNNAQRNYWEDSLDLSKQKDALLNMDTLMGGAMKRLHQLTDRKLLSITNIDSTTDKIVVHGKCSLSRLEKAWYIICQIPCKPNRLLGFIITALMLSLGAPFWFDLLKRLVALRGAGVKPEEKKQPTEPTPVNGPNNTPTGSGEAVANAATTDSANTADASDQALESMTQKLKDETSVVAIGLKPQTNANPPQMAVEVMVSDADSLSTLQEKYGTSVTVAGGAQVPVEYTHSDTNVCHGAKIGSEIGNKSGNLGQGTLGCFLHKNGDNNKYLLSCWHVLKDNNKWTESAMQKTIVDTTGKGIGTIIGGCLTDTIDVGFAIYTEPTIDTNTQITIKGQHRAVKPFDALVGTQVKLFGKVCGLKEAKIFSHKTNVQLMYPKSEIRTVLDVFSIGVQDSTTKLFKSPTLPGDSGAVVTDMNGIPLGLIIGGNSTFSYAVKFSNIFDKGKLYSEYSFILNT